MRPRGIKNGSQTDRAFEYIVSEVKSTGLFPSHTEIRLHMGWKSTGSVRDMLLRLCLQGKVKAKEIFNPADGRVRYAYDLDENYARRS